MTQLVENITRRRIVRNYIQESILDHIYTSNPTKSRNVKIKEVSSSDHAIIYFTRDINDISNIQPVTLRNFKNFNEELFLADLEKKDWVGVTNETEINRATQQFTLNVINTLDTHAPLRKIMPRSNHIQGLSEDIKTKINEREDAYRKCRRSRTPEDIEIWKKLKTTVCNMIRDDKKRIMQNNFKNPKSTWSLMKTFQNKCNKGGPPTKLAAQGRFFSGNKEMAEHMNNFFINKIKANRDIIEDQIPPYRPEEHLRENTQENLPKFDLKTINSSETLKIIESLKNSRSEGCDAISNRVLKMAKHILYKPLTHIINLAIETGKFPALWKQAKVVPLHKKGCTSVDRNYRPIALLSKPSLILETVLFNQITDHFTSEGLFSEEQNGYIKGRSTVTALVTLYDQWVRAANESKFTGILMCDMTAAFDLVDSEILIKKLEVLGASIRTTRCIKNYLSGRKQCVTINSTASQFAALEWGVPQGSKLGPLLFNIYTCDMPRCAKNGQMILYADDSALSVSHHDPYTIGNLLNEDAIKLTNWMLANKLLLAPDKTEFMLASGRGKERTEGIDCITLKVGGKTIKQSKDIKMLGVIFNRHLTMNSHLHGTKEEKGLIQNLSQRLWMLKRLKYCPEDKMRILANGIFNGKLMYAIQLFGGLNEGQCNQLQLLQNKAARLVTQQKRYRNVKTAIKQCKWLDIKNTVKMQSIILLYKIRKKKSSKYILNKTMGERAELSSQIPTYEYNQIGILKSSFIPRTILDWNKLPHSIRHSPSIAKFKSNLRQHYYDV